MFRRALIVLSLTTLGCTPSISMSGFELEVEDTNTQLNVLEECAARELSCSIESLQFRVISVHDDAGPDMLEAVGVQGCGKVGAFKRADETWFLESIQDEGTGAVDASTCPNCPVNCALPEVDTNGYDVEVEDTKAAVKIVRRAAATDLECAESDVSLEIVTVHDDMGADMPTEIQATGCGKSVIYERNPAQVVGGWSRKVEGAAPVAPASPSEPVATTPKPKDGECEPGAAGCACFENHTCSGWLLCTGGVCVEES